MMNRNRVVRWLVGHFSERAQEIDAGPVTEKTRPIRDLGFDSPDGPDFACDIEDEFDINVPLDVHPLVNPERTRDLCVGEIADLIVSCGEGEEGE
ncbi:MAG: acyl carrier protein [Planctomycetota bacterium]|jgi:acyl carrier protein